MHGRGPWRSDLKSTHDRPTGDRIRLTMRTRRLHLCADALSLAHRSAIEREVERQHIHPRLAQEAEGTPLDMLLDQLPHAIFGQIARFRNTGHLEKSRFG